MNDTKYILDTNICIALLRGDVNVASKLKKAKEGSCFLSVITMLELFFGAYNSGREQEICKVKQLTSRFPVVELQNAAEWYGRMKKSLRISGMMIDEFDLLIAATALAGDFTLVTDNLKHFKRIEELKIENWINRK